MSKIVKSIKRVIKKVGQVVKKIAKSKIGKMIFAAAAIYFGAPMVMGAFGASGAAAAGGLSGMAGASANLSAAWSGLTGAASSVMSGNFATAAGQLGAGAAGNAPGLIEAAASPATHIGSQVAQEGFGAATNAAGEAIPNAMNLGAPVAQQVAKAPASGLINGWMSNPYAQAAAIQAGGQLVSGIGQGIAAKSAQDHQDRLNEEERRRYGNNIGTRLWAPQPAGA